jgi:protein MpaA
MTTPMPRSRSVRAALRLVTGLLLCVACSSPTTRPPAHATAAPDRARPDGGRSSGLAASAQPAPRLAGISVEGRPIHYRIHGSGAQSVLLVATIHGDEDAGTPLLQQLDAYLQEQGLATTGLRVISIPLLNPDGRAHAGRHNAHGVDLNRNFPASNRRTSRTHGQAPLSEPEARALRTVLEQQAPSRVLSIHGWVGLVDWDGPAAELARATGAACGLPAKQIGSRPGSLGSWLGVDQGVPILTLELPTSARRLSPEQLWARYGDALLTFIRGASSGSVRAHQQVDRLGRQTDLQPSAHSGQVRTPDDLSRLR